LTEFPYAIVRAEFNTWNEERALPLVGYDHTTVAVSPVTVADVIVGRVARSATNTLVDGLDVAPPMVAIT
jgi:hypothetical protein